MKKKTLSQIGEFGLINLINKKIGVSKKVLLGIGDDTAILPKSFKEQLLTLDMLVENIDFSFKSASAREVGRKALAVNLSDIAAMGGKPASAVVGLALPRNTSIKAVEDFYSGMIQLAKGFNVSIVGGDLSQASAWMISVALLGEVENKAVLRKNAKHGDLICVTGSLGGSILKKHLTFVPRVQEGRALASVAHSMIDISDGFLQDLSHILDASHVSAQIWLDEIPVSQDAFKLARGNRAQALQHALTDGEDFELLFTIPKNKFLKLKSVWERKFTTPLTIVGTIVKNSKNKISFWRQNREVKLQLSKKGYKHF